jgi:hypothetical protein
MSNRWSKWWWLQFYFLPSWSPEELRAAASLAMTALVAFLVEWAFFTFLVSVFKFEFETTLAIAFLVVLLLFGRSNARIAAELFPNTVGKGDAAAARRLGGTVYFPDESPGIWWVSYRSAGGRSHEEAFVIKVVYCIAMPILFPTLIVLPPVLRFLFEFDKRTSILATMITMLPLAFFIGRRFCSWMWPDESRIADVNAWASFNRANRKRNADGVLLPSRPSPPPHPWPSRPN